MLRFKEVRDILGKKPSICPVCNTAVFTKVAKVVGKAASLEGMFPKPKGDDAGIPNVPLQTEMILRAFQRITDENCEKLGFNPKFARPEWMICTVLAVPPLTVRPSVVMDDNQKMEDDLTHKLIDVLRHNQSLRDRIDKGETSEVIDRHTALLQYDVATYVDNDIEGMTPRPSARGASSHSEGPLRSQDGPSSR
jgi:DNA-directed RNA polymerase beta' subunit